MQVSLPRYLAIGLGRGRHRIRLVDTVIDILAAASQHQNKGRNQQVVQSNRRALPVPLAGLWPARGRGRCEEIEAAPDGHPVAEVTMPRTEGLERRVI